MAHLIDQDLFDELIELAGPLIVRAREIAAGKALLPAGTSPEEVVLTEEAQAFNLALMALCRTTPLAEAAVMVSLGAVVGTFMAQGLANHADLWRLCRSQVKTSYDEVRAASAPLGGIQ